MWNGSWFKISFKEEILNSYKIQVWSLIVVDKFPLCLLPFVLVGLPGVMKELRDIGVMNYSSVYYPLSELAFRSVEGTLRCWRAMNHGLFYPLPFVRVGHPGMLRELCYAGEPWTMVSLSTTLCPSWTSGSVEGTLKLESHEPWSLLSTTFCPSWTSRSFEGTLMLESHELCSLLSTTPCPSWTSGSVEGTLMLESHEPWSLPSTFVRVGLPGVLKEFYDVGECHERRWFHF